MSLGKPEIELSTESLSAKSSNPESGNQGIGWLTSMRFFSKAWPDKVRRHIYRNTRKIARDLGRREEKTFICFGGKTYKYFSLLSSPSLNIRHQGFREADADFSFQHKRVFGYYYNS